MMDKRSFITSLTFFLFFSLIILLVNSTSDIPIFHVNVPHKIYNFQPPTQGTFPELKHFFDHYNYAPPFSSSSSSTQLSSHLGPDADSNFVLIAEMLPVLNTTIINSILRKFTNIVYFPTPQWLANHLKSQPPLHISSYHSPSTPPSSFTLFNTTSKQPTIQSMSLLNMIDFFVTKSVSTLTQYTQPSDENPVYGFQFQFFNITTLNITSFSISDFSYHYTPSPITPSISITLSGIDLLGRFRFNYELEPLPFIRDDGLVDFHLHDLKLNIKLQSVFNVTRMPSVRHNIFPSSSSLINWYTRKGTGKICSQDVLKWDDVVAVPLSINSHTNTISISQHKFNHTSPSLAHHYYYYWQNQLIHFNCPVTDYIDPRVGLTLPNNNHWINDTKITSLSNLTISPLAQFQLRDNAIRDFTLAPNLLQVSYYRCSNNTSFQNSSIHPTGAANTNNNTDIQTTLATILASLHNISNNNDYCDNNSTATSATTIAPDVNSKQPSLLCGYSKSTSPILIKELLNVQDFVVFINDFPYILEVSLSIPQLQLITSDTWFSTIYNLILNHYNLEIKTLLQDFGIAAIRQQIRKWLDRGIRIVQLTLTRLRKKVQAQFSHLFKHKPPPNSHHNRETYRQP